VFLAGVAAVLLSGFVGGAPNRAWRA